MTCPKTSRTSQQPDADFSNKFCCNIPTLKEPHQALSTYRGCRRYQRHAQHDMNTFISSTGSCQVLCVSLNASTVLRVITPHDRESPEASSRARHEREFLSREDEKDQK